MRSCCALILALLGLLATGCRHTPPGEEVPVYNGLTDEQVLLMLADRAEKVGTFSASGVLRLDDTERGTVTLDVVLLAEGESRLRLRAWKLGRAVFDLTRDGEALWLWTRESLASSEDRVPSVNAEQVGLGWSLLSGRMFRNPPQQVVTGSPILVTFELDPDSGTTARLLVDPATATVRRYEVVSPDGIVRQALGSDRHRLIDGQPIATRIMGQGAGEDGSSFMLELTEVELNGELPAEAFTPPRNAQRRP
ncbi:MAG: hypothetical protein AAGH88_12740 [Planctomycetota bacterium]